MVEILVQFIPLALASVSPIIMLVVILLIGTKDGLRKSSAFTLGKYLVYLGWGVLFLAILDWIVSPGGVETPGIPAAFMVLLGILLLVLAGRSLLGEDKPDDVPLKWMTLLDPAKRGGVVRDWGAVVIGPNQVCHLSGGGRVHHDGIRFIFGSIYRVLAGPGALHGLVAAPSDHHLCPHG